MMTTGAKANDNFVTPRGCMKNNAMRMASVTPMMVPLEIEESTTSMP